MTRYGLLVLLFFLASGALLPAETLRRVDIYDSRRLLTDEEYYKNGRLWQRIHFDYDPHHNIVSKTRYENESFISKTRYFYRSNGAVWLSESALSATLYTQSQIITAARDTADVTTLIFSRGRLQSEAFYTGNSLTLQRTLFYTINGQSQRIVTVFPQAGRRITETFDTAGRLLSRIQTHAAHTEESRRYTYNAAGTLTEELVTDSDAMRHLYRYTYHNGSLSSVSVYRNGSLRQITVYNDRRRTETYYIDNRAVLRQYYLDDRLEHEEVL
jgi:YD repeat-containing protein